MTHSAADDVERTARDTTVAQWGVASIVMVGSMASGGFTVYYLGEPWPIGVVTALAVDLALTAWLRIARRLRALGITSLWGWALEGTTAAMNVFLNVGAAVFRGIDQSGAAARGLLAVVHSFLPVTLVLVTIAGGEAQLKLLRLRRDRAATERAERDAAVAAERAAFEARQREQRELELRRANGELVDATDVLAKAADLRAQAERERATAAELRATTEAEVVATKTATEQLAKLQRQPVAPTRSRSGKPPASATSVKPLTPATRKERREWVWERYLERGTLPAGAAVDTEFGPPAVGSKSRTGAAIVTEVAKEIAEIDSRRAAVHAVEGGN